MSRKSLTFGQDLLEQARIRELSEDEARKRIHALYREEGRAVPKDSDPLPPDAPRLIDHPSGLALSGGGIRSATFNLGVLQALRDEGLLGGFDYLSTVSGGGYIGGFWSKWRTMKGTQTGDFPKRSDPSLRHLRNFSNFLRPRLSLISFETGRMATAFLAGLLPTLLVTIGFMTLVLLTWCGTATLIMDPPRDLSAIALLIVLSIAFLLFHKTWIAWSGDEDPVGWDVKLISAFWTVLVLGLALAIWYVAWQIVPLPWELRLAPVPLERLSTAHWAPAVLPAATLLLPILLLVMLRAAMTGWITDFDSRRRRLTTLEAVLSRALFLALVWLGLGIAWVCGQVVAGTGLAGLLSALSVSGAGSGVMIWARRFLRPQPNKPGGGRLLAIFGTSAIQIVAYVTLLAFLLLIGALISTVYGVAGLGGVACLGGVATVLVLLPLAFNPQEIGFHSFYRQRLARAYLGAVPPPTRPERPDDTDCATLERATDEISLDELSAGRPFHLICCAANDLAGDPIKTLHRGAESAVLSGLGIQVENSWRPWANPNAGSRRKEFSAPSLGSAMTASAAAFNSHMGSLSMKLGQAATFLLTALNLRLGMWIDNPRSDQGRGRLNWSFYRELLGLSDLTAAQVHLSDGAHFENLGLYELIRRRCRFVVVCDCGGDPDYAFDDLANAVRRVRTDFGVEIDLDPEPLRPGDDGKARQAVVGGVIRYPVPKPPDASDHCEGDETSWEFGLLLLTKPTLVGGEPADVRQYSGRNQDFPQETTADQFYDEEQWEAYRCLGEHVMAGTLAEIRHLLPKRRQSSLRRRFRWAMVHGYKHWLPRLELDAERCLEVERRWGHLETRLARDRKVPGLARDVLTGGAPVGKSDSADDPGRQLRYVLAALQQMEGILQTFQLDQLPSRPQNYGWINHLGRWATSDAFRAWWPWLGPTASRDLRHLLEESFDLPHVRGGDQGTVERIKKKPSGYAYERWVREKESKRAADEKNRSAKDDASGEGQKKKGKGKEKAASKVKDLDYGYFIPFRGAGPDGRLMKAFARVRLETPANGGPRMCRWTSSDLHLPAGLWGVGLAEAFIEKLVAQLENDWGQHPAGLILEVTFKSPPANAQLTAYSGAGFTVRSLRATKQVGVSATPEEGKATPKEAVKTNETTDETDSPPNPT